MAQALPRVILTWQANNFYPASYLGKPLPTQNTPVTVSLELVRDGALTDLSRANISWYVDNIFIQKGDGMKYFSFLTTKGQGNTHVVRALIILEDTSYESFISIPITSYQTIIRHTPQHVRPQSTITLEILPYFFNISSIKDLKFSWKINNQSISKSGDNTLIFDTGTPQNTLQRSFLASVFTQNQVNPFEFNETKTTLLVE